MNKPLNLKSYHDYHHTDAFLEISDVIENSKLPGINRFVIDRDPYRGYPEVDVHKLRAILLFPTMPIVERVRDFLDEGILIIPISHLEFIPDSGRKKLRWSVEKVTYTSLITMFYKIAELTVKFLLSHNPNVHIIGVDEFGRVLTYKYLKHTKEFMLNHVDVHNSFSDGHLKLLLDRLAEHDGSSVTDVIHDAIDLPELYREFLIHPSS